MLKSNHSILGHGFFYFEGQLCYFLVSALLSLANLTQLLRLCVLTSLRGGVAEARCTSGLRNNRTFNFLTRICSSSSSSSSSYQCCILIMIVSSILIKMYLGTEVMVSTSMTSITCLLVSPWRILSNLFVDVFN